MERLNRNFAKSMGKALIDYYKTGNAALLNRRLHIGRVNAIKQRKLRFFQQR